MVGKVLKKRTHRTLWFTKKNFQSIVSFILWLHKYSSKLATVSFAVIYETIKYFIDYFRIWKSFMNKIMKICLMEITFEEWRDE